jgi:GxxExxY protein
MHPKYDRAHELSREVIGAGVEVHRVLGPGLLESIYERCLRRELELRGLAVLRQQEVEINYKGFVFTEELRFDLLVDGCLLVEVKATQEVHPIYKAQLLSYMKLLDVPLGLLMNFHEERLVDGVSRMMLREASGRDGLKE